MSNSIYIGLSRQMALRSVMDTTANNVANMNTSGFRREEPVFVEELSRIGNGQSASFVKNGGTYKPDVSGSMRSTGSPTNAAIAGSGFFGVQSPAGGQAYTRSGDFQRAPDGTLLTSSGAKVSSQGGGSINIPADSVEISIDENGVIANQNGAIAQLMVVEFQNPGVLMPLGGGLYASNENPTPAKNSRVMGGMVENSNVEPIGEMTGMVDTMQSYQGIQKLLESENERLRSVIQKLTRQG